MIVPARALKQPVFKTLQALTMLLHTGTAITCYLASEYDTKAHYICRRSLMIRRVTGIFVGLFFIGISATVWADAVKKSVEAVHAEMASLKGKQVQVSGKVVKVNNGIMKRNFLHIQDGTGKQGTDDLTITSAQTAEVGDDITAVGTVVLDTDFGFGYKYPLLVEQSTIQKHAK
jgi:hypothetical protein